MATIKDIANRLGIASSTVSKGLNGASDISEELRRLVLDTAVEMGYTSKRMKKVNSKKLCIFVENMEYEKPHHFGYDIILGFKQLAINDGFDVDVISVNPTMQSQYKYDTYMLQNAYSAAFLIGFEMHDDWMEQLAFTGIPTVLLDNYINKNPNVGSVSTNSLEGIDFAIEHLANLGHEKIAFLNGTPDSNVSNRRYNAFITAMTDHGLNPDENLIKYGHYMADCAKYHIPAFIKAHATAILCASDLIAKGVIEECQANGINVPNDISIIGFDDLPISARLTPSLTTIHQDRNGLGKCAYFTVSGLLKNVYISNTTMHARLIVRNSTTFAPKIS